MGVFPYFFPSPKSGSFEYKKSTAMDSSNKDELPFLPAFLAIIVILVILLNIYSLVLVR